MTGIWIFLKAELRGFVDGSYVRYEKKRGQESSLTPRVFGLSHWGYSLTCGSAM